MKSSKIAFFSLAFILPCTSESFAASWEMNDVTYLFPLPNREIEQVSVRAQEIVGPSALIPREFFDRAGAADLLIGDIVPHSEGFDKYADLFAVGVRIDPCFKDIFQNECRKQIRVVWQPVDHWKDDRPNAVDAALHTFYDLTAAEFETLLNDLQALKTKHRIETRNLPLGIHPGFSSVSATAFQADFKATLFKYIDFSHLRRIAVMRLAAFSLGWDLFSHDFDGRELTVVPIFNRTDDVQQVMNAAGVGVDLSHFDGTTVDRLLKYFESHDIHDSNHRSCSMIGNLAPEQETGDQLLKFLTDSGIATQPNDDSREIAKTYFGRATRIENPAQHLPGTIDCLSCHAANMTKLVTAKAAGIALEAPTYSERMNLKNTSKYYGDTHNLRMLGYLGSEIQLGDRVIFESAAVAEALSILPHRMPVAFDGCGHK